MLSVVFYVYVICDELPDTYTGNQASFVAT